MFETTQVLGLLTQHCRTNFSIFYQIRSQSMLRIMQKFPVIKFYYYIIKCLSMAYKYLRVWVSRKDIRSRSLPAAADFSFLPLKDQPWENGSVFSLHSSWFWQNCHSLQWLGSSQLLKPHVIKANVGIIPNKLVVSFFLSCCLNSSLI